MRRDTGEIISEKDAAMLNAQLPGFAIPLTYPPTERQQQMRKIV